MNFSLQIARRLVKGKEEYEGKISGPVIRISILSVVLGMIVMIIAISVVTGFQKEIKNKVIGFGSHIQINAYSEGEPIDLLNAPFYENLKNNPKIASIQPYAYKAGIMQNRGDTIEREGESPDVEYDVLGILCKGINKEYDVSFIEDKIVEGTLPDLSSEKPSKEIVISRYIANKLRLSLNEKIDLYFPGSEGTPKRVFTIAGIYESGFDEYDKELVIIDLRHVQKLNNWGVEVFLEIKDTAFNNHLVLEAKCKGGSGNYRFDFGNGFEVPRASSPSIIQFLICAEKDTTYRVVASDFTMSQYGSGTESKARFVPDTAWLKIEIDRYNDSVPSCFISYSSREKLPVTYSEDGYRKEFSLRSKTIKTILRTSGGTYNRYVGGFEISIKDWKELENVMTDVLKETRAIGHSSYRVNPITELKSDIFGWLEMLDMNVVIILVLTVFVAVINMSSALLVLILERTNMIGILKAMGASNWKIQQIFIYNAVYLIGKGMIWGNVIGIGLCLLQQEFNLMKLDQQTYYISTVPINLDPINLLLLNGGTLIFCTLTMVVPSLIVTRIAPVKAIKFN